MCVLSIKVPIRKKVSKHLMVLVGVGERTTPRAYGGRPLRLLLAVGGAKFITWRPFLEEY